MKDIITSSNILIEKIKDSVKSIERAEAEKEVIEEGKLAFYLEKGGTMYVTCLTDEQIQKVKDFIYSEIDSNTSVSKTFLSRMLGNDTNETQPVVVIPETKAFVQDYDKDMVVAELKAGRSMREIHDDHYPDKNPSWLYKKLKADGVDYNSIITSAIKKKTADKPAGILEEYAKTHKQTLEDFNPDDWVDMGIDAPDQEDTWGLASSDSKKDKA